MSDYTILVIDDSTDTLEIIQRNLESLGHHVLMESNPQAAVSLLESSKVDLVITDLMMPGINGLEVLRYIRENYPNIEVMMVTGYATVNGAVSAVKSGAEEYLAKPFTEEELKSAVERALMKLEHRRGKQLKNQNEWFFHGMLGRSLSMRAVFDTIKQVSPTPASVLISGESGTGKELVARAIHYSGPRAAGPFVPINCGAIPENLMESELFGYVKGAFTGAETSRAGFFQTADKGTIFLDEISETSPSMQVKLLRVLQEQEINMVGSSKSIPIDVRVLSATNHDLESLVEKGLFRRDLFYRLNVVSIKVPPLRARENDIVYLARMFLEKFAESLGQSPVILTREAENALLEYSWPGNVRELENLMQRLVIMTKDGRADVADLPKSMHYSIPQPLKEPKTLAEMERKHIAAMMKLAENNKTQAARILGIDRKTLRDKLSRMNID